MGLASERHDGFQLQRIRDRSPLCCQAFIAKRDYYLASALRQIATSNRTSTTAIYRMLALFCADRLPCLTLHLREENDAPR